MIKVKSYLDDGTKKSEILIDGIDIFISVDKICWISTQQKYAHKDDYLPFHLYYEVRFVDGSFIIVDENDFQKIQGDLEE